MQPDSLERLVLSIAVTNQERTCSMEPTKISSRSRWLGWLAITTLGASLGMGCAATDEDTAEEARVEKTSEVPVEDPNDDTSDKGLKRDFCCAVKEAYQTLRCIDMHRTKVIALGMCKPPSDNVLRNGQCRRYDDCLSTGTPP